MPYLPNGTAGEETRNCVILINLLWNSSRNLNLKNIYSKHLIIDLH